MPTDEYSSYGGGALKLKGGGGKVKKHKKKKDKASDLEKALSTGEPSSQAASKAKDEQLAKRTSSGSPAGGDEHHSGDQGDRPVVRQKTEAERRFEEAKRKKVSYIFFFVLCSFCCPVSLTECVAFGDVQVRCWAA